MNEYLQITKEILLPHYLKIFNLILNTGLIPFKWSLGVIIPIHKKGEVILTTIEVLLYLAVLESCLLLFSATGYMDI